MSKRLLVIGLDGFEASIADRLVAAGRMPNLQRLQQQSARVELDHGAARRTGLAWEHFSTGLRPSSARRWSAVTFDSATYQIRQEPTRLPPFPAGLPLRTVVFDAPYFSMERAPDVQGIVAWGAHDPGTPQTCNPASLAEEMRERFGDYPAKPWIYGFTWPSPERTREMGEGLVQATRLRTDICRWLFGERLPDWELGIVVVSELHSAIEALWHGVDATHLLHGHPSAKPAGVALEAVYEAVDELVGALVAQFPDCAHLVFSMHGMGHNSADVPAMALLPELLYQRAFGSPRLRTDCADPITDLCQHAPASWSVHVRQRWIGEPGQGGTATGRRSLANRVAAALPLPRPVRRLLRGTARKAAQQAPADSVPWMPASWYAPYWRDMPAFAFPAYYDGQIRINVKGREQHGLVEPADYDRICNELAAELRACRDPATGQPAIGEIDFTHPGDPMAVSATEADMIVVWHGTPMALETADGRRIGPLAPRRPGGHTGGSGISLWHGADFEPGDYPDRSAFDVVPSLLEYLGVRPATPVDGQSFLNAMTIHASAG